MATLTKPDLDAMTVDERLDLLDLLHESLHDSLEAAGPPDWHRKVLDEILDEDERDPQPTVSWQELKAELSTQWQR